MTKSKKQTKTPYHYDESIQPIDLIESFELNFSRGNIIKYVCRAAYKGEELDDLQKALYYLQREINNLENK
jgi:Protein of unknwon function (DUF3310)